MASSRFPPSSSTLHQRDPRPSTLFDSYSGDQNRAASHSPAAAGRNPYAYSGGGYGGSSGGLGAHPRGMNGAIDRGGGGGGGGFREESWRDGGFRPATPNKKGQYSDAVLSELENQNDAQLEGMSAKVKMLKDITVSIGNEIRESTSLADSMNENFEGTRLRLKGTMKRMMRMAERTGVGWKVWLLFFVAIWGLFAYVWLF